MHKMLGWTPKLTAVSTWKLSINKVQNNESEIASNIHCARDKVDAKERSQHSWSNELREGFPKDFKKEVNITHVGEIIYWMYVF